MSVPRRKLIDRAVQKNRDARLYFIIPEGAETEKLYFLAIQEKELIPRERVKIHVIPPEDHANAPAHLIGLAEDVKKEYRLENFDEIWLVFDVDQQSGSNRLTQLIQSAEDASRRGWRVAISNPCFEVWLLLHITDDLTGIDHRGGSAETSLRNALGAYNKCRTPAQCLSKEALLHALERARAGDRDPRAPIPELPGTRVYQLLDSIFRTFTAPN